MVSRGGNDYQAELAAKALIGEHRKQAFERTFRGTSLRKQGSAVAADGKDLAAAGMSFATSVADAAGSAAPAELGAIPIFDALGSVLKLIGIEEGEKADFEMIMAEELAVLTTNGLIGIAEMYVPYLSTVIAGKEMMKEWVNTAIKAHRSFQLSRTIGGDILPGDPQQAAQAVRTMIKRAATNHARLATINSVKFGVDVAATAGGFGAGGAAAGPATGAAAAGAKLANALFLLGRDYLEMKSANDLLTASTMPSSEVLFGAYPLLGCYLIVSAEDSDLLYFFMGEMGGANWMDKIEKQKKRTLGPLQEDARKFIADSRFELNGFSGAKVKILVPKKKSKTAHLKSWAHRVFG